MKLRSASILAFGSLLSLAFAVSACNPTRKGQAGDQSSGGAGGAGGSGGAAGDIGQGGTGAPDISFGGMGGGTAGSGGVGFEACASAKQAPSTLPLNIYVAIDKSGSMAQDNKWNNAKAAFLGFFQDPANAADGLSVALRFWPDGQCNDQTCSADLCKDPQVPLGPLSDPNQVQALVNLYNQKGPGGNTPMDAALGGAAQWAIENAKQGEGASKTVIIFLTDGQPVGCDENINNIAQNAADAYTQAEVPTFAVGLAGSNEAQMTTIAVAGNTMTPFMIGNGNAQADLTAALKEIQKTTLACVFAMPEATGPDPIDPTLVNLTYTPKGGTAVTVGQVNNEGECSAAGGWGWFYDDPNKPSVIQLCPALCENVQKSQDTGTIEVILGCETKPA